MCFPFFCKELNLNLLTAIRNIEMRPQDSLYVINTCILFILQLQRYLQKNGSIDLSKEKCSKSAESCCKPH